MDLLNDTLAINDLEQRSPEWFKWRRKGIGSSDAAVLMGLSPYKSINRLWLEKTEQIDLDQTTSYMAERGTRLEAKALREYIKYTGIHVVDHTCQHPKFKFVKASLDGWNSEFELIVEIKCPRKENHYRAVAENFIKPEYYSQIQHQYLASGAKYADFWSFDGVSGHKIPVLPDSWFMGELLEREIMFWDLVERRVEPSPGDFKKVV
jgi:putative phage-type endonuclease